MTAAQLAWAALGLAALALALWLDVRREGWPWRS